MVNIMRAIKDIDKEHNGYVTSTELDDILKINYKNELTDKNLKEIFRPYASIQNRILIDYKKFRDYLLKSISDEKKANESRILKLNKFDLTVNDFKIKGDDLLPIQNVKRDSSYFNDNYER